MRVGAAVGGVDVLGYHAYAATATWLVSSPDGAPTPNAAAPDWQVYYAYDRWRPTFYASTSSETSFFAGPATDAGTPTAATRRERQLQAGVLLPIRHARVAHAGAGCRSFARWTTTRWRTARCRGIACRCAPPGRRSPAAPTATRSAAKHGVAAGRDRGARPPRPRVLRRRHDDHRRRARVPARRSRRTTSSPLRVGGGASTGDPTVGRTFLLGGDAPAERASLDFGSSAISLLRGFAPQHVRRQPRRARRTPNTAGRSRARSAASARGRSSCTSIHAAVFADAGHAWTRTFRAGAIKTSAGARAVGRRRRRILRAVHADGRRRVGTRRQRPRRRSARRPTSASAARSSVSLTDRSVI